jgi:peptidoglycan-associated lipoprotein
MQNLVRIVVLAGASVFAALTLTGCPDKKPTTPGCKTDKECKDGKVCVANACVECASDANCGKGKVCKANACVASVECNSDSECPAGKVCQAGVCKACTGDSDCGPGGTCDAGACKKATACKTDEQCADDEDCVDGFCKKPWKGGTTSDVSCTLSTVYFGYDDSSVMASERDRLDANYACLDKNKSKNVTVSGHTDTAGTEEYNIALSERRAQSVADYLARLGLDPARMQVVPKGETEPSGQGDDKDRRADFIWK